MRHPILVGLALLGAAQAAPAQSVKLPAEVRGQPAAFVVVRAETDCAELRWVPMDPGLSLLPPELLKDSRSAVVMAPAGRYRLLGYGAKGDRASEPAVCIILIGDAPPPGPGPAPPSPPDAFTKSLQDAYAAEADPQKATHKARLAELYRQAGQTTVHDAALRTAGALFDKLTAARKALLPDTALVGVRQVVARELTATMPARPEAELTPEVRQKAAEVFARIARALGEVQ